MKDNTRWSTHRRYLYLLAKFLFFGLVIYVLYTVWGLLSAILGPLALSLLIAYLLDPFVDWFEERRINRTVAIFLMMLALLLAVGIFVLVITPTLVEEITILAKEKIPNFLRGVSKRYLVYRGMLQEQMNVELPVTLDDIIANYGQRIQDYALSMVNKVTQFTGDVFSGTWSVVASLLNLLTIPLFVFYFLRDFDEMKVTLRNLIPLPFRGRILLKLHRVDEVVGHWFRGQLIVASILGVLYTIGLGLCQVKLWFAIGIFAGLVSVVPYLGLVIGVGLALLMSLLDDTTGVSQFIAVIAVFTVVQTFESYVITPRVVGEKVGLSPLMVIVVLLLGAELGGLMGVLLSIPVAGALRVFWLDTVADYKRSRFFLGDENYLQLLARGPAEASEEVREALRQAAEADLDMPLPDPLTPDEIQLLSVAMMRSRAADQLATDIFRTSDRFSRDAFHRLLAEQQELTSPDDIKVSDKLEAITAALTHNQAAADSDSSEPEDAPPTLNISPPSPAE
ncbi:MAG: AI-2E family transporter, partial [Myxococcota bacterium]